MLRTLLRWLVRLFFFGLIVGAVGFVVTRLLGGEDEDFEDLEDLDEGFEFNETPVEIEVSESAPASIPAPSDTMTTQESHEAEAASAPTEQGAARHSTAPMAPMTDTVMLGEMEEGGGAGDSGSATSSDGGSSRLIDIKGIGPSYEERLHSMGITTLQELTKADPNHVAEELGVIGGASTVEDWIGQAHSMLSEQGG